MNVIGIDYQQTLSTLALREGRGSAAVATSIGDGRRSLVPHAIGPTGVWGSDALRDAEPACAGPLDPLRDGPWLDSPAAGLFWQALYARLVSYLGRVRPTAASGYQVTVAMQGGDWDAARAGVQSLCAQAGAAKNDPDGLRETMIIPATEALLCRWLSAPSEFARIPDPCGDFGRREPAYQGSDTLPDDAMIAVVALGDSSTLVGAYRVQHAPDGSRRISARPEALQHLAAGISVWHARLLAEVCSRFSEERAPGSALEMRDAAFDFAWRLSQAAEDGEVTWQGAGHERMYARLCLTRAEVARWPEAHLLQTVLPQALQQAADAHGKNRKPDRILIGGVGALWPFAGEIANKIAPTWRTSSPQMDVAFGAAAWREVSGAVLLLSSAVIRIEPMSGDDAARRPDTAAKRSAPPRPPLQAQTQTPLPEAARPVPGRSPEPAPAVLSPAATVPPPVMPLPAAPKQQEASAPPATHHAPLDGDEWNAPEPGVIPPWERE